MTKAGPLALVTLLNSKAKRVNLSSMLDIFHLPFQIHPLCSLLPLALCPGRLTCVAHTLVLSCPLASGWVWPMWNTTERSGEDKDKVKVVIPSLRAAASWLCPMPLRPRSLWSGPLHIACVPGSGNFSSPHLFRLGGLTTPYHY